MQKSASNETNFMTSKNILTDQRPVNIKTDASIIIFLNCKCNCLLWKINRSNYNSNEYWSNTHPKACAKVQMIILKLSNDKWQREMPQGFPCSTFSEYYLKLKFLASIIQIDFYDNHFWSHNSNSLEF